MRNWILAGTVMMVSGCSMQGPTAPTQVTWAYGAGNGDGVQYSGAKPVYARSFGAGNGDSVTSGATARNSYSYGADGMAGSSVMFAPPTTQTAAPAVVAKPAS